MNFQQKLDEELNKITKEKRVPKLLLHVCCAPCNSYVLEYLNQYFDITVFYYNPNISIEEEYRYRISEELRFLSEFPLVREVKFIEGDYNPNLFYEMAKGREELLEGGLRCYDCYELRLRESARYAKEHSYDYFTTTLSISPHKNANWLNEIGGRLENEFGVSYLYSDFKKKNGYHRSIELSREYQLYRQDYCGCIYSKAASEKKKEKSSF